MSGPDRRDQIMVCARYVFAQEGYEGARTADIAEQAGVSERLMYKHFLGKRELFIAVAASTAALVADGYRQMAQQAPDIDTAMRELYDGRLGPGRFHGRTRGVFFARVHGPFDDPDLDGAISAAYRTLADAATAFFARMVERGLVRPDIDPEVVAWNLNGILHLHDLLWSAHTTRRALALERRILDSFIRDLQPRKA